MAAGLIKSGLELQINRGTAAAPAHGVGGSQTAPDVAALSNGDFIVAFQSISELGDQDIYAQQITAAGAYDDVQRDVAAFTPDQTNPTVAPTAGGGYVTAWEGFSHSIQLNVFNPLTGTFSTPLTIRDTSANPASYSYPTIATFANGNYVLSYESQQGSAPYLEIAVVNPGATALVKGIEIADSNISPSPAVATAGNTALIAYLATDSGPVNPGFHEVEIYEIDSAGNTLFSTLLAESSHPAGSPQVAGLADGRFAVVWTDGTFGNETVRGAIFDPVTHSETGIDFTINPNGNSPTMTDPHVAATPDGGFVVAWDETGFPRDSGSDVFAQRFNGRGERVGSDIEVNSVTSGYQGTSSLAVSSDGHVLVSWTDFSASNANSTDVNPGRIQGQLFNLAPLPSTISDLNGDGTSDVLWIDPANDTVGDWLMNSGTPTWQVVGQGSSTVNVEGFGDFTGNSTSDILWENPTNGVVGDWLMNNNVPTWQQIGVGSTTMNIAGVGDFNGDGSDDILWQNPANNYVGIWQMQNNVPTWEAIGYGSTTVNIAGVGDFTGTGKSDILWENPSNGVVGMWSISGTTPTWSQIGQGSTTMNIVGTGDFTGNGTDDILWENPTNGLVGFWGMTNGQATSWNVIATASTSYLVADIGDYYGNSTDDILWRNATTGDVGVWAMNNGQATWHDLGASSTAFNVVKS